MTDSDIRDTIAAVAKIQNVFSKTGKLQAFSTETIELRNITNFEKSIAYRKEANQQTEGADLWPVKSPAAIERGDGAYVFDLDGNKYLDCLPGRASVNLGHAYKPVINAVVKQLHLGSKFQRPANLEHVLGKAFLAQIPGHERIRIASNGRTVVTTALKLLVNLLAEYVCRPTKMLGEQFVAQRYYFLLRRQRAYSHF